MTCARQVTCPGPGAPQAATSTFAGGVSAARPAGAVTSDPSSAAAAAVNAKILCNLMADVIGTFGRKLESEFHTRSALSARKLALNTKKAPRPEGRGALVWLRSGWWRG